MTEARGPASLFWNPANLFLVDRLDVTLGYSNLYGLGLARHTYMGLAFKHVRSTHELAGSELVSREEQQERFSAGLLITDLGLDLGSHSYGEVEATAGLACMPTDQVLFGASLGFLSAKADLDGYSASGVRADFGMTVLKFDPVRFALAWRNFYSSIHWKGAAEEKLPFLPSAGFSYAPLRSLRVACSATFSTDGGVTREESMGLEWYPQLESLALRAGLKHKELGDRSRWTASFGAGFSIGRLSLDYAYVMDADALGDTQWFAGGYRY